MEQARQKLLQVSETLSRILLGRPEAVELALIGVAAGGHILIEDVPGVGKTTLGLSIANVFGLAFKRVQMTSDLLPTDLTGVNIWDPDQRRFVFRPGPLFANIVLADELNRTPPKTQSALLEAMEERRISVDGETHVLEHDFFVIATQNPVEQSGTFELPESQMDRFLICMDIGYPSLEVELDLLLGSRTAAVDIPDNLRQNREILHMIKGKVSEVSVHRDVGAYMVNLVAATRKHPRLELGVSPRGLLGLRDAARAKALLAGRDHVLPDDVKAVAVAVLAHRVVLRGAVGLRKRDEQRRIIQEVLEETSIPA